MAIKEDLSHIDPIEHLRRVNANAFDMTSAERSEHGGKYDAQLIRANSSLMLHIVSVAYHLYPDDETARDGYIRGSQDGINFMRDVWAAQNLAAIVPFDTVIEAEIIPSGDFGALDLPPAGELPNDPPTTAPSQG